MKDKIIKLLEDIKLYWKVPPKGRYMSFKEIASLSFGGIGVRLIVYTISQMMISVGNVLIGNTIGIDPSSLYVIYIISVLSAFPLTALRARMIDNTRSMKGKYRPYLISMGIPTVLLGAGFMWMPYERMSVVMKCASVLAFNIGFQFFFRFYNDAYDSLINVLSPNSIERSDVLSIKSVVENLSPSIVSIFLPLAAKAITGDNTLYDLKIYRVLFPPMLLAGFLISVIVYVNTEEKIIRAKTHVIGMKFSDAFRAVARNKYFWIISLAGWLGFLEGSFGSILGWMYNYQHAATAAQYSLITAISGNASFWPNLVAPFFIRKYGKKKILVFTNLLNIGFILLMLPIVRMTGSKSIIWLLLGCTFVNQFITSLGHLLNPSVNADIRDYQQYVSGERIDGMFAAVGLIGEIITLATGFVLPTLYSRSGLNAAVALSLGYDGSNVYDVLYDQSYFVSISSVLIVASVIGAVLNVLPMFFYDLTETKQKAMVKVLKIRALFEDRANNVLNDEKLCETVEIINSAREHAGKDLLPTDKKKLSKQQRKQNILENEEIEIAKIVNEELTKYETEYGKFKLENSRAVVAAGLDGSVSAFSLTRAQAKAMPRTTQAEKERRNDALLSVSDHKAAVRARKKYFPDGIKEFDSSVFDGLFASEDALEREIHDALLAVKGARERNDRGEARELKKQVEALRVKRSLVQREIKKATDGYSVYYRAAKPYLDAKRTLSQAENYERLDDLMSLYGEAKERIEAKNAR
ncbi:MAG: MFS transporter [Clostridiales bacterium]|nr:MFS transporter [Clostridiales bacterium]